MALERLQGLGGPINYVESMVPDFRREALMETQNRMGQQQVASQQMQNQQQLQENQRRQEFYSAIGSATPEQLPALRRQFPEFAQNIQQEIGIQGAEHAAFVHGALNKLSVAASSGNPQQLQATIQQNGPALASMGVSPEQAMQLYQQDPARFNGILNAARLATLPMEKQFDIQSKEADRGVTMRGQDISAETARRGQNLSHSAQMARLNHDKMVYKQSQAQLARAGAAEDMDVAQLNATIASTGMDPLTGKAATGARMAQATKWNNGNNSYNDALITGERGIEKVDALLNKKSLDGVGRVEGRLPDMTTSSEGLSTRNTIEELKSGAFVQNVQALRGMGALSNAEGSKLENLIAKLDITQPEEVVRKQLQEIRGQYSVLQKVADREAQTMGYSSAGYDTYVSGRKAQREQEQAENSLPTYSGKPQQAAVAERAISGISDGTTATNPRTGQKLVYRGGQWQPM